MRYGEMTAFEERPHSPYYGSADATPLYVVLLDEYERWTGDTQARPRARARGPGGAQLARRVRRSAGQRLRLLPATQRADRAREPVLEGLLGLDLLPRRPPARLPARHLRAAGLRLRREDPRRPARARDLERPGLRRPSSSRQAADLKRRFNRDFWVEDGEYFALALDAEGKQVDALDLEQRPPALERHRRQVEGEGRRRPPARAAALLRLGRAHAGRGRGTLQPDRLPRRHGLALRQLVHRLGPSPLRLQGGGRAYRRPASSTPPTSSTAACPRRSAATSATRRNIRCSTRPPAARRPGRRARRSCSCARCSASSRSATTSSSTPRCPSGIGMLALLDIPGRWGRIDAFARGRSQLEEPARRRVHGSV